MQINKVSLGSIIRCVWSWTVLSFAVSACLAGMGKTAVGQSLHTSCPASSVIKKGETQGRWRAYIESDQGIWSENPTNGNTKKVDRFQCLLVVNKNGTISSTKCFATTGSFERQLSSGQLSVLSQTNCTFTGEITLGRVPASSGAVDGPAKLTIHYATMSADWLNIVGFGGDKPSRST